MHARESWNHASWPQMSSVCNRVGFLLESPQDPKTYLEDGQGDDSASFWAWPETLQFLQEHECCGMSLIHFDQGSFGHVRKKPTTCMTNLPDLEDLNDCRSKGNEKLLEGNLDDRLRQTAAWSLWAVGLRTAIKMSLLTLFQWYGFGGPKLSKTLNLEQWKQHINQGHKPYRRDCRTCVLTMAGAKPHRRREGLGSSAWTMSVDLVHMPKSKDLATKRIVKYALVATALVPVSDSPPGDEGKEEKVPLSVETVDGCWGEGLDEESFSLDVAVDAPEEIGLGPGRSKVKKRTPLRGSKGCGSRDDLDEGYVPTTDEETCDENMDGQPPQAKEFSNAPKSEPLDPEILLERDSREIETPKEEPKKDCGAENVVPGPLYQKGCGDTAEKREGEGLLESVVRDLSKPLKVRHVTLMEPVESRNVNQVISAMNLVLTKMHFLGVVVNRIHSDRAKELLVT